MRYAAWAFLLCLAACDSEKPLVVFAPDAFLVSKDAVASGDTVIYRVSGSFGIAEIYQGDARVSLLTDPNRITRLVAVSSDALKATVWGNNADERRTLSATVQAGLVEN